MLADPAVYALVGYRVGEIAGDRVAAVDGLPADMSVDALKHFFAAAASAGAVGLCHLAGITPEAPTLEACFAGAAPDETFDITPTAIARVQERLQPTAVERVDLVTVGCPHYSFGEFEKLARRISGRRVADGIAFWAFTNRCVYAWIEAAGLLKELTAAGVSVFTDGCPLQYPKKSWSFAAAVTDSAKFAHYCRSQTGFDAAFTDLERCVEAACSGRFQRRRAAWQ
jgi:predicted aconitase